MPLVDRFKFVTKGRWLTQICERYAKNKTNDLQLAFFNGDVSSKATAHRATASHARTPTGFRVLGECLGGVEHDRAAGWRGASPCGHNAALLEPNADTGVLLPALGGLVSRRDIAGSWVAFPKSASNIVADRVPHDPVTAQYGVYASRWPAPPAAQRGAAAEEGWSGAVLWTIVNRAGKNLTGAQLTLPAEATAEYFDCYAGTRLQPQLLGPMSAGATGAATHQLSFPLEAGGFGCVVQLRTGGAGPPASLAAHLQTMSNLTRGRPLAALDTTWKVLPQKMVPIEPTPMSARRSSAASPPVGMVLVPHVKDFEFAVAGVEREGKDALGDGMQFPWEDAPHRAHKHKMELGPFFIDKFPVTCANYSAYLSATGYRPKDSWNWLKNWGAAGIASGVPPKALAETPVTHVGLSEARAYCAWAGGRLPEAREFCAFYGRRIPAAWAALTCELHCVEAVGRRLFV